jgi:hypothetical protein
LNKVILLSEENPYFPALPKMSIPYQRFPPENRPESELILEPRGTDAMHNEPALGAEVLASLLDLENVLKAAEKLDIGTDLAVNVTGGRVEKHKVGGLRDSRWAGLVTQRVKVGGLRD